MAKKILIVEDDLSIQKALAEELKNEGFTISTASDGKEGLIVAKKEHPDLILLDILLPTMSGIEMLKELRKDDWGKDASVILLTNLSAEENLGKTEGLGIIEYLVKTDWSIFDVVKKIKEKLNIK